MIPDLIHPDGHRRSPTELLLHHRLLAWDIRPGDAVLIIGGFFGTTVQYILDLYPEAVVYTADPQPECYEYLRRRFANDPRVHVLPYALGDCYGSFPMSRVGTDMASFMLDDVPEIMGEMQEFGAVMQSLGIERLAWLHMNIEGYEYVLLPHLLEIGWLPRIGQLAIAAHALPGDSRAQSWGATRRRIEHTHLLMWTGGPQAHRWWAYSVSERTVRNTRAELAATGAAVPKTDDWEGS